MSLKLPVYNDRTPVTLTPEKQGAIMKSIKTITSALAFFTARMAQNNVKNTDVNTCMGLLEHMSAHPRGGIRILNIRRAMGGKSPQKRKQLQNMRRPLEMKRKFALNALGGSEESYLKSLMGSEEAYLKKFMTSKGDN